MALSGEQLALHHKEADYQGDPALVGMAVMGKYLHMLSGAPDSGKKTVLKQVVSILPNAVLAWTFTDRTPKVSDISNHVRATSTEKLKFLINNDEVVNYAVDPVTGSIRATLADSFPATHNFIPILTSAVPQVEHAGFKDTTHAYLTLAGNAWKSSLGKEGYASGQKSVANRAIVSLTYAQDNADDLEFVRNRIGQDGLANATKTLLNISVGSGFGDDKNKAMEDIAEMLAIAKDLAVRSK